ncbi:hypothetical protein ABT083_37240 [Streptomyces goshikiensis]|uniref:hypothetical protein n=1 Tax=Streptomyces goshikiensis TaxID=1942 RepID=UPI00331C519B
MPRLLDLDERGELTSAHVGLVAKALGKSERTVWRWLAAAKEDRRLPRALCPGAEPTAAVAYAAEPEHGDDRSPTAVLAARLARVADPLYAAALTIHAITGASTVAEPLNQTAQPQARRLTTTHLR